MTKEDTGGDKTTRSEWGVVLTTDTEHTCTGIHGT